MKRNTIIFIKQQWHQFYIGRDTAIYLFKKYYMEFDMAYHALMRSSICDNNEMR